SWTVRRGRDVVVPDSVVALDEVTVVLGVVDGRLGVVTGERLDGVQRVPERECDELGAISDVAAQQPRAAVARRGAIAGQAGLADVGAIRIAVLRSYGAGPDTSDHGHEAGMNRYLR